MFGTPGKQAVTITPRASAQISKLMASAGHAGLRIGVKKGGCAGMEYTMEYVDQPDPNDEVVEQDGAKVLIAPMAQMFLLAPRSTMKPRCWNPASSSTTPMSPMPVAAASRSASRWAGSNLLPLVG